MASISIVYTVFCCTNVGVCECVEVQTPIIFQNQTSGRFCISMQQKLIVFLNKSRYLTLISKTALKKLGHMGNANTFFIFIMFFTLNSMYLQTAYKPLCSVFINNKKLNLYSTFQEKNPKVPHSKTW